MGFANLDLKKNDVWTEWILHNLNSTFYAVVMCVISDAIFSTKMNRMLYLFCQFKILYIYLDLKPNKYIVLIE